MMEQLNTHAEARAFLELPQADVTSIETLAAKLRNDFTEMAIIGTGGSGMSGRLLAALAGGAHTVHVFDNLGDKEVADLKRLGANPRCCFLLISKSGTTLETLVFADILQQCVSNLSARVYVITIPNGNVLHAFAQQNSIPLLPHAEALGGRFSALSVVGLLPAAFAGVDIRALLEGAKKVDVAEVSHHVKAQADLIAHGKTTHVLMVYAECLMPFAHWWRQCFSESLGKDGKGAGAVIALGPKDQHSQLQLYMEGPDHHYFTFMTAIEPVQARLSEYTLIPELKGKSIAGVVEAMCKGTVDALRSKNKSVRLVEVAELTPARLGQLLQSTMLEIALLGLEIGVNPFTQPAVEEGKKRTRHYLSA